MESAVAREVKEERGASLKSSTYLDQVIYPHPSGDLITQHVFFIKEGEYDGEMGNREPEKEELSWVSEGELIELCTSIAGKAVLALLSEQNVITEGSLKG